MCHETTLNAVKLQQDNSCMKCIIKYIDVLSFFIQYDKWIKTMTVQIAKHGMTHDKHKTLNIYNVQKMMGLCGESAPTTPFELSSTRPCQCRGLWWNC